MADDANAWDGFGRLASSATNMGGTARTLASRYDADGDRTYLVHPDGTVFRTYYDLRDRAFLGREGDAGRFLAGFSFDPLGRVLARSNQLGAAGYSSYAYDPGGGLSYLNHDLAGTGGDYGVSLTRNPAGQIASLTRANDAYAWTGHYAVSRGYTANGLNQYVTAGGTTFAYDANGNLTGDGSNAFVYDIENRLVSATGAHHARLDYDPLGRLWQVTDTGTGAVTRFLYDGDALVAEYDGAGAMTHRYAHWAGADTPMAAFDGAGLSAIHHLFADHEGSIVALADGAGALVATNTYDEYGIPGAANQGRFQYTGQAWLAELGMYYYRARIYSPTLGRFLQTDPVGYADQFNLYAYVGNDPVNHADPTGNAVVYVYDQTNNIVVLQTFDNHSQFTDGQIAGQGHLFSGTTSTGQTVITTLSPGNDSDAIHLRLNPHLNAFSPNPLLRSHTDRIGGRQVELAPNDPTAATPAHEIGHGMGAGDQYVGGVDAQGQTVTTAPPSSANSIMRDLNGPANHQTLDEIVNAPTNTIKHCTVTVIQDSCE